jgi:hypothetical protein
MKQTAVEWLIENIPDLGKYIPFGVSMELHAKFQQALEMEKQQAERSYSKEEVDDLLDRLLEGNMCSVAGDELIEKFQKK